MDNCFEKDIEEARRQHLQRKGFRVFPLKTHAWLLTTVSGTPYRSHISCRLTRSYSFTKHLNNFPSSRFIVLLDLGTDSLHCIRINVIASNNPTLLLLITSTITRPSWGRR
jgi:hypothetical protein